MRQSIAHTDNRKNGLIRILEQYGQVRVKMLADELDVSPLTIRRDLDYLQEQGLVKRSYGKATLLNPVSNAFSSTQIRCKNAIAKAAAQLVQDQDTILINTSSTALLVLKYLSAKNVTIVTNNGKVMNMDLEHQPYVILTGGELRFPKESMVGDITLDNLRRVYANIAFIGCSGLSTENGVSTAVMAEGSVNRMMMERAEKVVIVADHTKIGSDSNFPYVGLEAVDHLITDASAKRSVLNAIRKLDIEITIADK